MDSIVVLGSGPAGCTAALHLSKYGLPVTLVAGLRKYIGVEGLSPRVVEGLRNAGCLKALASVGPEVPRRATWNGETTAANREYLVERMSFDAALVADARAAGVPVIETNAVRLQPEQKGWRIDLADGVSLYADYLVEARGRRAPRGGQVEMRGPRSLALARWFSVPESREMMTAIASIPDGWAWVAHTGRGRALLQIMVAGAPGGRKEARSAEDLFQMQFPRVTEAREWLGQESEPAGPVDVREATPYRHSSPVGKNLIRIGDAAFAIDPLSGHGIFEAVGSAMTAAAVIHTLRDRPRDGEMATEFYAARGAAAFLRHARVGRDFYRAEARWEDRPFWQERRDWPDDKPVHAAPLSAPARIDERPVIESGFIARRPVIVTPDHPWGVRHVDGVELVPLLERLNQSDGLVETEDLAKDAQARPEQVETAIAWLRHRQLVAP